VIQIQAIQAWLQERQDEFLDDLRALVNIDCGTSNKTGVDAVGGLFSDRLRAAGFELTEFPLTEYGDCCLATLNGNGRARILLVGHLDTVYPDGTAAARPMQIEGRRIIGPGVSDMKAGLLAGLYAVRALRHFGTSGAGNALDRAIRRAGSKSRVAGTRVEITGGIEKNPMEKTAATAYLVELAQGVAAQIGLTFDDVQTGGTSDGNFIAELGLPVLDGMGPIGGDDHSPSEYLEAYSIVPRTTLLAGMIAAIATHRDHLTAIEI
jgi:acetylornithine deacetylase/succinyl-diaminopimelate desuccinylase-like protein